MRVILGGIWATGLFLTGLAWLDVPLSLEQADPLLLHRFNRAGAICLLAAAWFVFLVVVADAVFPRAPATLRALLKASTGLICWITLLLGLYWGWDLLGDLVIQAMPMALSPRSGG